MQKFILKVLKIDSITRHVKQIVLEKPKDVSFIPGQATELSINKPGLENQPRPFTFVSPDTSGSLEFIIKIYEEHKGVTEKLGQLVVGDELILNDVFGTISYKGPGLFIAAGTGITPFLCIFRDLKAKDQLGKNQLLFANRTEEDVILKDELSDMLGENYKDVIGSYIDMEMLKPFIEEEKYYYICGPDPFVVQIMDYLRQLGVPVSRIIVEQD